MDYSDLLEIVYSFENNEELLSFVFPETGIPMWMHIRLSVISRAVFRYGFSNPMSIHGEVYNHPHKLYELIVKNPFFSKEKSIVYAFFNNALWEKDSFGNVGELRFLPFFMFESSKSTTLVDFVEKNKFGLHCDYPNWKSTYSFSKLSAEMARYSEFDTTNEKSFVKYLMSEFPVKMNEVLWRDTLKELLEVKKLFSTYVSLYKEYLSVVRPKIVFVDHASYTNITKNCAMTVACKENSIPAVEFQHGIIPKNYYVYNYGTQITESMNCRRLLPDYLLTKGEYWNSVSNSPVKKYVVGSPNVGNIKNKKRNNCILFAADDEYDGYIEFLDDLFDKNDLNLMIYFRFHPEEHDEAIKRRFFKYLKTGKFCLANDNHLSYYMELCDSVIVDGSTVGYEALASGHFVFALKNKLFERNGIDDPNLVYSFSSASDFLSMWEKSSSTKLKVHNEYNESNWEERYKAFLSEMNAL